MITLELTVKDKIVIVSPKSAVINTAVCNDALQHMESKADCTLVWEPKIFEALVTESKISAVIKDNGEPIFTGSIQTDVSWRDIGRPYPVDTLSVTINDNTVLFDKKTQTELALINTDIRTVVATLCEHCGAALSLTHGVLPTKAIQAFVADEGKSYKDLLGDFLFSYGYSYYFDSTGKLCVFNFASATADLEHAPKVGDTVLAGEVQIQKSNKRYTGVKISYNTLTEKKNELIYFFGSGYGSTNKTQPAIVQPNVYYPFESAPQIEATDGQVWQSFEAGYAETYKKYNGETDYRRSKKTSLLYTQNHQVVQDWTDGIVIDRTMFGARRASVRLQNKGTQDAKVHQLSIRADAWYRNAEGSVTVGKDKNPYGYQSEFVYNALDAETLAKALSSYLLIGQYQITTTSETALPLGVIQKIDCGVSGFSIAALAYSSSFDAEKSLWTTKWISAAEPAIDVARFKSLGHDDTAGALNAAAENAKKIDELANGSDTVPPPDTPINLKAVAEKDGLRLSCKPIGDGLKNSITKIIWEIKKTPTSSWQKEESTSTEVLYRFNRGTDGYPESPILAVWKVRAKTENIYGKRCILWAGGDSGIAVDVSTYGTWQPSLPKIASRVSGRNVTLFLSQLPRADGREVYGKIRYQMQIKREPLSDPITGNPVAGDTQFYKPATDKPYLVSEDNYKDGVGFVMCDDVYMQVLPLYGQNKKDGNGSSISAPIDTPYTFAAKAINESGKTSSQSTVRIIALATAARDLVNNAITNNKLAPGAVTADKIHAGTITARELYAGNLAAGGASFGRISAGGAGLQADNNNFWDLENQEFRIGNDIRFENSGSDDAEYLHYKKDKGIFFKLKNFILSSLSSTILGVFRVKGKGSDDASGFFVVNPTDQTDDVTGTDKKTVKIKGGISADEITGTQFKGATLQLTDALASPFATISEKTKTKDLEVTKKAKIVEFEAVEATTGYLLVNTKATAGAVETFDLKVSKSTIVNDIVANGDAKVKSIAVEHGGWRATVSPCDNGVELLVCGGDNGAMQRKQLQTIISGDSMDLRISGNVYCNNIYRPNMFEAYQRIPDINNIRFVYYANNTYVACGAGIHISNNLVEWKRAGDIYSTITGVAYVRGTWFAIESGYSIYYSYDLARWNKINYSTIHFLQHISSNENVCCVTNGTGKILLIGSNAMWTEYDIGNYALHYSLCDGGKIVVFGADVVVIGKGLLGWDIKPGRTFLSAAYGREKWVAVEQGGKIFYTQNPETGVWTECYDGYKDGVKSIVYNNDMFVAFGSKTVLVSTDAISWEKHKLGEDFNYVPSITGGNFAWLVVASSNLFKFGRLAPEWKQQ